MPTSEGWRLRGIGAGILVVGAATSSRALAAESCPEPVTARAFHQAVSAADTAYGQMDLEGFQAARAEARTMIPCLAEPLSPAQAAGFHRLEAMGDFLARDHAGAVASLRALAAAAPGYELSETLAPPGHPMLLFYDIARGTVSVDPVPLPATEGQWVRIDGASATVRPVDRPYLYQSFEGEGQVMTSTLVPTGQLPPGFDPSGPPLAGPTDRVRTARTLGWVSMGTAALAGGLYLGARSTSARFWDPSTPTEDLDGLRTRTNALGWTSASLGMAAFGTGGAALLVGTW
jgi:hypothetical protein